MPMAFEAIAGAGGGNSTVPIEAAIHTIVLPVRESRENCLESFVIADELPAAYWVHVLGQWGYELCSNECDTSSVLWDRTVCLRITIHRCGDAGSRGIVRLWRVLLSIHG